MDEKSKEKFESYKFKLNYMLSSLENNIARYRHGWAIDINWNKAQGGFFIKMDVPFVVDDITVKQAASKYKIIFCPMRNFYIGSGGGFVNK